MATLSKNGIEIKRRVFKRETDVVSFSQRTNNKMLKNHKIFIDYGYRSEWYTIGWKVYKINDWKKIEEIMKKQGYVEEVK